MVQLLAPPPFSGAGSAFYPHFAVDVGLQFTIYILKFCWVRFSLPRGCTGLFPWVGGEGVGRGVAHGA
jgi:hypothetical protein